MMIKKERIKYISKEETNKARTVKYIIFALTTVVLCIVSYILFSLQTIKSPDYSWWSNLCMNFAVGTAVTAFFFYFNNIRVIKYRINTALINLNSLIHHVYFATDGLQSTSPLKRNNSFIAYVSYRTDEVIDIDIIRANKPVIYQEYEHFIGCAVELEKKILKENRIETYEPDEVVNIISERDIQISSYQTQFINNLKEICDRMRNQINKEIFGKIHM